MRSFSIKIATLVALTLTIGAIVSIAKSSDAPTATIGVENAWVRPTIATGKTTAGYATLTNMSQEPDRLIAVKTDQAAMVQMHITTMTDGIMRMRRQDGLDIPPGGTITLAPGGAHLMIMGLSSPLQPGDKVTLTFTFEKAGDITLDVPVEKKTP